MLVRAQFRVRVNFRVRFRVREQVLVVASQRMVETQLLLSSSELWLHDPCPCPQRLELVWAAVGRGVAVEEVEPAPGQSHDPTML